MSWAMVAGGRVWHYWRGDTAICGQERRSPWSLGRVAGRDCPRCLARLGK